MSRQKERKTTITVSEENYRKLLELKTEKRGSKKRINFDEIITILLECYHKETSENDERREEAKAS